ncbi:hypothetical protein INS49_007873 [Diaporthe citri]|uniref:uncharacterized protein n=1 Tax=Diaporthe citri TaxID=83186 RepID=UPI001C821F8A|nr:uncharacterized protein INS49_007873 [Diaporthe citri]KAG6362779.1 hypothetical protein INS49_007873 [Diaporthe citri]
MHDRFRSHQEMGDVFMMVTPGRNWLYIANPDALMDMFRRRAEFPQCIELTEVLNVFGTNLGTVEGQQWKTQRKMIATCFNEPNNEIVWSESLSLARDMLKYWVKKPSISSSADDLRTLSLHVLAGAGFGKSFEFEGHDERRNTSLSGDYKTSLQMILENCILIMDEAKSGAGLTESEIYGNMFMLNFAGHDTTAHTLTFAIHFLAANPAVQDWVSEEARTVLGERDQDQAGWDYAASFPRLRRCFAVLLETLRLYTPVPVAKWTAGGTASLEAGGRTYVVPPNTMVIPSYAAVHTEPKYWGSDSLTWRPSRWIQAAGAPGMEELITPQKGTFLGWSEGARDCPARKFSQVEFVATVATLLRDWRVDPVPLDGGESLDHARKRVLDLIEKDSGPVLLQQMLHPERASLTWTKR